ncbi:MAG: tetratricopeptide repeat protein [Thermodesulfovibrionia bacterium]
MMNKAEEFYNGGRRALKEGMMLEALALFEKAFNIDPENPNYQSFFGFCIAYERGTIRQAIDLCEKALKTEPEMIEGYLNLGRIYLRAGLKVRAVEIFRDGLKIDNKNPEIIEELNALGLRKGVVISFFLRKNVLNKYLGIIFNRLGLR